MNRVGWEELNLIGRRRPLFPSPNMQSVLALLALCTAGALAIVDSPGTSAHCDKARGHVQRVKLCASMARLCFFCCFLFAATL